MNYFKAHMLHLHALEFLVHQTSHEWGTVLGTHEITHLHNTHVPKRPKLEPTFSFPFPGLVFRFLYLKSGISMVIVQKVEHMGWLK